MSKKQQDDLCASFGIERDEKGNIYISDLLLDLNERVKKLENRFTESDLHPVCKQNHDWMLNHIKDIASEIEIERDENWLHEAGTSEAL